MTGGTIDFYIDDVLCEDTSGVGVNGKGGVFNCGLTGTKFTAHCRETCTPNFSVTEIKLWKGTALSVTGTPYYFSGSNAHPYYYSDPETVFKVGSLGSSPGEI